MTAPRQFHDLKAGFLAQRDEILAAVARVLDGGWYILGPEVKAFEDEFGRYCDLSTMVGTGSATESLMIGLMGLGIQVGDDVVVPALTAAPTAMAVAAVGARPIFCDIDPATYLIDPRGLERVITPRTRVVIAVDLYGQCADYDAIGAICAPRRIAVFEDASQAHGAKDKGRIAGTFGRAACFSFYPTKNLGAFGDAGSIGTNDPELGSEFRRLRNYGIIEGYDCVHPGLNARLDEIHAAMLRVRLRRLDSGNAARRAHAARYFHEVRNAKIVMPVLRQGAEHVFHQFVVRTAERDELRSHLKASGIETLVHYPRALHEMQCYKAGVQPGLEPKQAALAAAEIVSLPIYPEMTSDHQDQVIAALNSY